LEPLSVAVVVTDPPDKPMGPHSFMERQEGKPRMVVVGNAGFISNTNLSPRPGQLPDLYYTLFAGSLAWLREKPSSIGIPPKEHKDYQVDADTPIGRMLLLPFSLMAVSIAGLGLGIWLVRRQ
jgi:hypothetical protein